MARGLRSGDRHRASGDRRLSISGGPEPRREGFPETCLPPSPTHATWPSGRISTAVGPVRLRARAAPTSPAYSASTCWTRSAHGVMSRLPGSPEVEQHRPGIVEQLEDPLRAVGVTRSRSGIRRPSNGCPSPRSYSTSSPEMRPAISRRGSSKPSISPMMSRSASIRGVGRCRTRLGHRVLQRAGPGRVSLGVVGVQEAVG